MPTPETLERFIARVEENAHAEACEEFYTAQSSMQENQSAPRVGREAHVTNERKILARAKSIMSKCVRPVLVNGDFVVIRWIFQFEWHDGSSTHMEELAYQRWEASASRRRLSSMTPLSASPRSVRCRDRLRRATSCKAAAQAGKYRASSWRIQLRNEHRSGCPISLTLDTLGDKWSLIVIRDIMFGDRRRFRQLLSQSEEGIVSNILADRLKRLVDEGLLVRTGDPTHKQKGIYSLTEKAIQLVPILAAIGIWGRRHMPVSKEQDIRMRVLERGGPKVWQHLMEELRQNHLSVAAPPGRIPSIADKMQKAAQAAMSRKRKGSKAVARRLKAN